jgi:hypothetical protein
MEIASTLSGICKHLEWSLLTPWILLLHMTLSEATETGLYPKLTIGPGFLSATVICGLSGRSLV